MLLCRTVSAHADQRVGRSARQEDRGPMIRQKSFIGWCVGVGVCVRVCVCVTLPLTGLCSAHTHLNS